MARAARRPLGVKLLWASVAVATLAALAPPALYLVGLALAPELPEPPNGGRHLPPLVEQALWARFGGEGPVHLEPLTAAGVFRFEWCMAREGLSRGDMERCRAGQRDLVLSSLVSATHLGLLGGETEPSLSAALAHGSTTTWISRHWRADQLLAAWARTAPADPGLREIEQVSRALFGADPAELGPHQAALLAALYHQSPPLDPRRDPARARQERNRILDRMAANGALDPEELPELHHRPLDLGPTDSSRPGTSGCPDRPPTPSIPFLPRGGDRGQLSRPPSNPLDPLPPSREAGDASARPFFSEGLARSAHVP